MPPSSVRLLIRAVHRTQKHTSLYLPVCLKTQMNSQMKRRVGHGVGAACRALVPSECPPLSQRLPAPPLSHRPAASLDASVCGGSITPARSVFKPILSHAPFTRELWGWGWKPQASNHGLFFPVTVPQPGPTQSCLIRTKDTPVIQQMIGLSGVVSGLGSKAKC